MSHVNLEGHLRCLNLLLRVTTHLLLLLNGIGSLLLGFLMFSLGSDTHGFKHKALDLEHVERVVLLNCNFVLAYVVKELLEERIIGVLK